MPDVAATPPADLSAAPRTLALTGRLTLAEGGPLWTQLQRGLAGQIAAIDLTGVDHIDGGAAALLNAAVMQARQRGQSVELRGANPDVQRLLDLYACPPGIICERPAPRESTALADIGDSAHDVWQQCKAIFAFVGDVCAGLVRAFHRPRTVHFADLPALMEKAGADGLPIVAVINFLVGLILGLQGAIQLHRFGADPFLANLVGLSVVRELGPLMTAILVAGRTGAAYAAELGTMTVNEEVDALRTLGQDPQRFLVFPRVLALALVVPLLTAVADIVGCLGGLFIGMSYLEQPAIAYLQFLQSAVQPGDVLTGLLKSSAFAVLIGLVACQRGLSTRGGAAGVGASTTSAVVIVLFGLVGLDTLFTWVFSLLGW